MCVIEPSPVVETRRLALRAPAAQDISRLAALANDREIARMTLRMPHPYSGPATPRPSCWPSRVRIRPAPAPS
jgi:RimJ/RimL family protein N-acetyltransferase